MEILWKRHQSNFFVSGHLRSAIYDLQRTTYIFVPNELEDLWNQLEHGMTPIDFNKIDADIQKLLIDNELVFKIPLELKDNFPAISDTFETYNWLDTIHIHFNALDHNQQKILLLIEELLVDHLVIEFEGNEYFESIIDQFDNSRIKSVILIINNKPTEPFEFFNKLSKCVRITTIYTRFDITTTEWKSEVDFPFRVLKLKDELTYEDLRPNYNLFFESKYQNVFYNKKLFIDKSGELYNNLEYTTSFGNIATINNSKDLLEILDSSRFNEIWNTPKDRVAVCCHCEFRRMCIDRSNIHFYPNTDFYHRSKECKYNPFIAKWSHEEGYKTLDQIGVILNENEFSIDMKRIEEINQELWA